jgi:hypothetical protein
MHPRVAELLSHLDRERAGLRAAVDSIPVAARERRPAPERWSVAEILEHLALVERRLAHVITTALDGARAKGLRSESDETPVMGTMPLAAILDRSNKITAAAAVIPAGEIDSGAAWQRLEAARDDFRSVVLAADGLALGDVIHPHPRLGTLNLYQWIGFVGSHEARHAAQIREQSGQG